MSAIRGIRRREVLLGAGVAAAALTGFSGVPTSSLPRPLGDAPLTALTDPDLVKHPAKYANVPWDPASSTYPLVSNTASWWLVGSSTAEFAGKHVAALASSLDAQLHQDAKAGETDAQISARMGLAPARLSFPGGVVPAGSRVWGVAAPIVSSWSKPFEGRLEGTAVTGVLSWDRARRVACFERTDGGAQVTVPRGVRFMPDAAQARRADLALFLGGGKNSVTRPEVGAARIVAGWEAQHAWLAPQRPAFLRQGFFANAYAPQTGAVAEAIAGVNEWGRATLGARFLDVESWLADEAVWDLVGTSPTAADREAQRSRRLAPSLADVGGVHLSDVAAAAWVHNVVGPRILALGWA